MFSPFPVELKKKIPFPVVKDIKARLYRRCLLRSFSFWCMRLNGLTYECIRTICAKLCKSILLWLNHSIAYVRIRKITTKIAHVNGPFSTTENKQFPVPILPFRTLVNYLSNYQFLCETWLTLKEWVSTEMHCALSRSFFWSTKLILSDSVNSP